MPISLHSNWLRHFNLTQPHRYVSSGFLTWTVPNLQRDIWNNPGTDMHESYSKSPSMMMERQLLNEKLRNMMKKSTLNSEYEVVFAVVGRSSLCLLRGVFQDAAILTAVKAPPTPTKSNWHSGPRQEAYQSVFGQKSVVTKAEDLEKEYSKSDIRFDFCLARDICDVDLRYLMSFSNEKSFTSVQLKPALQILHPSIPVHLSQSWIVSFTVITRYWRLKLTFSCKKLLVGCASMV